MAAPRHVDLGRRGYAPPPPAAAGCGNCGLVRDLAVGAPAPGARLEPASAPAQGERRALVQSPPRKRARR